MEGVIFGLKEGIGRKHLRGVKMSVIQLGMEERLMFWKVGMYLKPHHAKKDVKEAVSLS